MRSITFFGIFASVICAASEVLAAGNVTLCNTDQDGGSGLNFAAAMLGGGAITFQCPSGSKIRLTKRYDLYDSTHIDGEGRITLDAAGGRMFVAADESVRLTLANIMLINAQDTGPIPLTGFAYFGSLVSGPMTVEMENVRVRNSNHPVDVDTIRVRRSRFDDVRDVVIRVRVADAQETEFNCNAVSFPFAFRGTTSLSFEKVSVTGCGRVWSSAETTIKNSRFVRSKLAANQSPGAALVLENGQANIEKSTFVENSAPGGGAIYVVGGTLKLRRVEFVSNMATGPRGGGAILAEVNPNYPRSLDIEAGHVTFRSNQADRGGAVLLANAGSQTATFSGDALIFQRNIAQSDGGAMFVHGGAVALARGVLVENEGNSGGALAGAPQSSIKVANSLIVRNRAHEGSAFIGASLDLTNVTIWGNRGVAIVGRNPANRSELRMRNTMVAGNADGNCALPTLATGGAHVIDDGNNLQSHDGSCGATILIADPQLDDQFYVPQPLSPARRAGNNTVCLSPPISGRDVYGEMRPQGDRCTIGAVEGTISRYALRRLRNTPEGRLERDLVTLRRLVWPHAGRGDNPRNERQPAPAEDKQRDRPPDELRSPRG